MSDCPCSICKFKREMTPECRFWAGRKWFRSQDNAVLVSKLFSPTRKSANLQGESKVSDLPQSVK